MIWNSDLLSKGSIFTLTPPNTTMEQAPTSSSTITAKKPSRQRVWASSGSMMRW